VLWETNPLATAASCLLESCASPSSVGLRLQLSCCWADAKLPLLCLALQMGSPSTEALSTPELNDCCQGLIVRGCGSRHQAPGTAPP
jgi:hypothetical protein